MYIYITCNVTRLWPRGIVVVFILLKSIGDFECCRHCGDGGGVWRDGGEKIVVESFIFSNFRPTLCTFSIIFP